MDEEEYFNADTMLRLEQKGKLIHDVSFILENLAKRVQVYNSLGWRGKRFLGSSVKSVYKDFKKGLYSINKKIPVFVELPKVKSVSDNGEISKTYDGENHPSSYEVHDVNKQKIENVKSSELIDFTGET